MPHWARLMFAAKWMKASPWDLAERDDADFWIEGASVLSNAEHEGAESRKKT